MKHLKSFLLLSILILNGCTHYESQVALGAIAGASTGALIVDRNYNNYPRASYDRYSRGYGYGQQRTMYTQPIRQSTYYVPYHPAYRDAYGGYHPGNGNTYGYKTITHPQY